MKSSSTPTSTWASSSAQAGNPPRRTFLGLLKEFYSEVNIDYKQCEVLYVPLDKTEAKFEESYGAMPWLAIPYSDEARIKSLKERYRVRFYRILTLSSRYP